MLLCLGGQIVWILLQDTIVQDTFTLYFFYISILACRDVITCSFPLHYHWEFWEQQTDLPLLFLLSLSRRRAKAPFTGGVVGLKWHGIIQSAGLKAHRQDSLLPLSVLTHLYITHSLIGVVLVYIQGHVHITFILEMLNKVIVRKACVEQMVNTVRLPK